MIAKLNFLTEQQIREVMKGRSAPVYVVSRSKLKQSAETFQTAIAKLPFGGRVKYAMKANPNPEIIKLFNSCGIGVDASSFYEARTALEAGVQGNDISLTSQELPPTDQDFKDLIKTGVWFNATSLHQLEKFLGLFAGRDVGVRLNPGIGSGYNKRVTTDGVAASFGIWYKYIPEALSLTKKAGSKITTLHTHIGTGTDPME